MFSLGAYSVANTHGFPISNPSSEVHINRSIMYRMSDNTADIFCEELTKSLVNGTLSIVKQNLKN